MTASIEEYKSIAGGDANRRSLDRDTLSVRISVTLLVGVCCVACGYFGRQWAGDDEWWLFLFVVNARVARLLFFLFGNGVWLVNNGW